MIKIMAALAIVISYTLYWATNHVCRYNFILNKKANIINILSQEVKPSLGYTNVYYFKELNCNNVYFEADHKRIIDNFNTVSVMVYQYLSTDIRGVPN